MPGQRKTRPAPRESHRIFQYQEFWLGIEPKYGFYTLNWYDPNARRTKRKTTGTRDLEAAKQELIKAAQATPPNDPQHPSVVEIDAVRRFYFEHHVNSERAGRRVVRDKSGPHTLLRRPRKDRQGSPISPWPGKKDSCGGGRDKQGLSNKSISTYLSYVKAGLRFCSRPRLIRDPRGQEREVQILSAPPHIDDSETRIEKVTDLPKSQRREWVPTDAELAATIDALGDGPEHEAVFRYVVMALNTWARPEAITELSVLQQVDFRLGIINLNPPGRVQNKKVRPKIRLTDNLCAWLLYWNFDRPIVYCGRPVAKVDSRTLRKAAQRAGVAEWRRFNRYALRHYMATRIRRVERIHVTREERATWMGHKDPHHSTTEAWYESFDPDYLLAPMRATDAIITEITRLTRKRSLVAPTVVPGAIQFSIIQRSKTGTDEK